jgi:hypothetical protein
MCDGRKLDCRERLPRTTHGTALAHCLLGGHASRGELPLGSRRVLPPHTEYRTANPRADRAPQARRGTREGLMGLSGTRDLSGSSAMGTEWGLRPFTMSRQPKTSRRSTAWPRAGIRGRRLSRHRQPAREPQRRPAGRPAPRSMTRAGRAIRSAPNPGTSWPRRARSERKAGRALGRRPNGTGAPVRTAVIREGSPVPDGRRRARPAT